MAITGGEWTPQLNDLVSDRIRAFAVFAQHLNFNRAAEELHISQPALHKKIKALEASLDVPLYITDEVSKRVQTLTPQGAQLQVYAEDMLRSAQDALAEIHGKHRGPLTIAAGRGAYIYVIGKLLKKLTKRDGGLRVIAANNTDAIQHARQGTADVIVIAFDRPPGDLDSVALASFPQTLVVRKTHRLVSRTTLTVGDLDGLRLALPERGERMREYLGDKFAEAGVEVTVDAEALNWDLLVHFVTFGVEATIVNEFVRLPPDLTRIPISDLQPATYYAAWRPERASLAQEFLRAAPSRVRDP